MLNWILGTKLLIELIATPHCNHCYYDLCDIGSRMHLRIYAYTLHAWREVGFFFYPSSIERGIFSHKLKKKKKKKTSICDTGHFRMHRPYIRTYIQRHTQHDTCAHTEEIWFTMQLMGQEGSFDHQGCQFSCLLAKTMKRWMTSFLQVDQTVQCSCGQAVTQLHLLHALFF